MPNQDGTGPYGDGRPGRGLGNCLRDFAGNGGRGMRRGGCGLGMRFRNRAGSTAGIHTDPIYPLDRQYLEKQKVLVREKLEWLEKELGNQKED